MTETGRRPLTAADARAYVAGGGSHCPYCAGEDISGGRIEVDTSAAWQEVTCAGCGAAWNDVFTLSAIDVLDEHGNYRDTLDGSAPVPIEELLAADAIPGEPIRPVLLYVGVARSSGQSRSWYKATVAVPRRLPEDRLGEAAIHWFSRKPGRARRAVAFVGVLAIPAIAEEEAAQAGAG